MRGIAVGKAIKATERRLAKSLQHALDFVTPPASPTRRTPTTSPGSPAYTVTGWPGDSFFPPMAEIFANDAIDDDSGGNENSKSAPQDHETDWETVDEEIKNLYARVKLIVRDVWDIPNPDRRRFPRFCPVKQELFTYESDINHLHDHHGSSPHARDETPLTPAQDKDEFNKHFFALYPHLAIEAAPDTQMVIDYGMDPVTVVKEYWKPEHLPLARVGDAVFTGEHLAKWLVEWSVYVHGCDSVETEWARDFGHAVVLLYETYMGLDAAVTCGTHGGPVPPPRGSPRFRAIMGYLDPATEFCDKVSVLLRVVARECQTAAVDGMIRSGATASGGGGELGAVEIEAGRKVVMALFLPGEHLEAVKYLTEWATRFNERFRGEAPREDYHMLDSVLGRTLRKG
ncbi:hypothetical protein Micbo1qcDRAFT_177131 [Microdochium bolleyi]|uniref:Uncharacterized protein n=1 Tax=Microdochium bolleyi TaxID=196109 RepID=A0A136IWI1_9PEZI|nr:hypothetical protein Micbo1qcDRAFT_177131 [Microdochium bolleyi]